MNEQEIQSLIQRLKSELVPVGSIMCYAAPKCPENYMPCDGRELMQSQYLDLFKIVGNTFGGGPKTFCLPDLQGRFIRGWDDEGDTDPEREFGKPQEDAIQGHCHNFNSTVLKTTCDGYHSHAVYFTTEERGKFGSKDFSMRWMYSYKTDDSYGEETDSDGEHKHSIETDSNPVGNISPSSYGSINGKVDTETRPKNVALLYCIKVR